LASGPKAQPMHKVAGVTVLTALIAAAPLATRADDDPATIVSELVIVAKPKPTALSGVVVAAKPRANTTVSGVEVSPAKKCLEPHTPPDPDVPAPRLVSTYPAKDQVVRPGLLVMRLTFDLPMACRGALRAALATTNPCTVDNVQNWILSYDRLNLRILCELRPGKRYGLWVNNHAGQDFQGLGGSKPTAYEMTFVTSKEAPVATVAEAVARDPRPPQAVKPVPAAAQ